MSAVERGAAPGGAADPVVARRLRGAGLGALVVGLLAAGALAIGFFSGDRAQWLQSYLVAYLYWVGISLGCLALLMLHHLVGGPWGFPIQRLLAAGARAMLPMAVLFLPILLGSGFLYEWADAEAVAADAALQAKAAYLNVPFFAGRAAFYFAVWLALGFIITRDIYRLDESGERHLARRAQRISGLGLILYVLTASFASVDWAMSLEPHWYSSIYGLLFVSTQALTSLAFVIAALRLVCDRPALSWVLTSQVSNDLGNLLLAALVSWVYMLFMQYLVIWSGNVPEEVTWYLDRTAGGWQWVHWAVLLLHFALPFALVLVHQGRWRISTMAIISAVVVVADLLYLFWLVVPAFSPRQLRLHWLHAAAVLAIGGLWLAWFAFELRQHSLVPFRHPKYVAFVEQERKERYETAGHAS